MITLTLYTTLGCHLCEQLEALVRQLANQAVLLTPVEISNDDTLMARYAQRIPVLADAEGKELDRGFDIERLAAWLEARGWLNQTALQALTAPPPEPVTKPAYIHDGRRFLG